MIGLDTNVLVRAITQDDPKQFRTVQALLDDAEASGEHVYVNTVVLCGLASTLQRSYRFDHPQLARAIEMLLTIPIFEIEHRAVVLRALSAFAVGKAGFPDYLIGELNAEQRAAPTATFDRGLRASARFRILD